MISTHNRFVCLKSCLKLTQTKQQQTNKQVVGSSQSFYFSASFQFLFHSVLDESNLDKLRNKEKGPELNTL